MRGTSGAICSARPRASSPLTGGQHVTPTRPPCAWRRHQRTGLARSRARARARRRVPNRFGQTVCAPIRQGLPANVFDQPQPIRQWGEGDRRWYCVRTHGCWSMASRRMQRPAHNPPGLSRGHGLSEWPGSCWRHAVKGRWRRRRQPDNGASFCAHFWQAIVPDHTHHRTVHCCAELFTSHRINNDVPRPARNACVRTIACA